MGNDISTRTMGEPRLGLVPDPEAVEQFTEPLPEIEEVTVDEAGRAPLAAYQNVTFIEVLGTPLEVETAVTLYEDLGDALAKAARDS